MFLCLGCPSCLVCPVISSEAFPSHPSSQEHHLWLPQLPGPLLILVFTRYSCTCLVTGPSPFLATPLRVHQGHAAGIFASRGPAQGVAMAGAWRRGTEMEKTQSILVVPPGFPSRRKHQPPPRSFHFPRLVFLASPAYTTVISSVQRHQQL